MIDLEEMLNCKDCRIKDDCSIYKAIRGMYCLKGSERVFKTCKVCGESMSIGSRFITPECVYCGHKFVEEKKVTISKEEHIKLLKSYEILSALEYFDVKHWKYYKDAVNMLNDLNNKEDTD